MVVFLEELGGGEFIIDVGFGVVGFFLFWVKVGMVFMLRIGDGSVNCYNSFGYLYGVILNELFIYFVI